MAKKAVTQKEKQKNICPVKTDMTYLRNEYTIIKRQPDPIKIVVLLIENNIFY